MSQTPSQSGCRVDVWLWRARFFKTRSLAAQMAQSGRLRLTRPGGGARLDKPSRLVLIGDEIVFAVAGRLTAVRVLDLGFRRGPPAEAKRLYAALTISDDAPYDGAGATHSTDLGAP